MVVSLANAAAVSTVSDTPPIVLCLVACKPPTVGRDSFADQPDAPEIAAKAKQKATALTREVLGKSQLMSITDTASPSVYLAQSHFENGLVKKGSDTEGTITQNLKQSLSGGGASLRDCLDFFAFG